MRSVGASIRVSASTATGRMVRRAALVPGCSGRGTLAPTPSVNCGGTRGAP
jgi:hypothetical protein